VLQWFCARGINRPGFLNPDLLETELRADNVTLAPAHLASAAVLISAAFAVAAIIRRVHVARRTEVSTAACSLH
jgi:hypothetical protein